MGDKFNKLAKTLLGEKALTRKNLADVTHRIMPETATRDSGTYSASQRVDLDEIDILPEYEFIMQALAEPDCPPLFVTGEAGTGKSTLIHYLQQQLQNCAIVAPTAIAAVSVNGSTIHALFALPHGPIDADTAYKPAARSRMVIESLQYLIVDEVSMVSPNIVDIMDQSLKRIRDSDKPFGGVKMLFIGDLLQLPPVVSSNEERVYFSHRYKSPYFFTADIFAAQDIFPVVLEQVRRQKDNRLIQALSHIRTGHNHRDHVALLNRECYRDKNPDALGEGITLVPTNADARQINQQALDAIDAHQFSFDATVEGNVPANKWRLPVPHRLDLKLGARVIMLKNNKPQWINGDLAEIVGIDPDHIRIKLVDRDSILSVNKATWYKSRYEYNYEKRKIETTPIASFTQYPMALGWAITIHKSQGMSLDKLTIDFGRGAFVTGQAYVALSRARSIEGLTLKRPLSMQDIQVSQDVLQFYQQLRHDLLLH